MNNSTKLIHATSEPNTTIITLMLPEHIIHSLCYWADNGCIDINKYIGHYIDLYTSGNMHAFLRNNMNECKYDDSQYTLPTKFSISSELAFRIEYISQRIQIPVSFMVKEAIEDNIMFFGYDYICSEREFAFKLDRETLLRDIREVNPDFSDESIIDKIFEMEAP